MSATGEGDHPESIGETGSKVVVDVPGFAEACQEHQGRSTATPINDFKLNMLSGLTGYGNESDVLCGRIDPVGPLGIATTPCRDELWALLAKGERRQGAGGEGFGSRRGVHSTASAAGREARDCEQHRSSGGLSAMRLRHARQYLGEKAWARD